MTDDTTRLARHGAKPDGHVDYDGSHTMQWEYSDAVEVAARELGEEAGRAMASWVFDGNTTTEEYARVLFGIEDGDPEVLDALPSPDLSGQWAGDPTVETVMSDILWEAYHLVRSSGGDLPNVPFDNTLEWAAERWPLDPTWPIEVWTYAAETAVVHEVERMAREALERKDG